MPYMTNGRLNAEDRANLDDELVRAAVAIGQTLVGPLEDHDTALEYGLDDVRVVVRLMNRDSAWGTPMYENSVTIARAVEKVEVGDVETT